MFVVIWQWIMTIITIEDLSAPLLTCSRRAPKGNGKVCHDVGRSIANLAWTIDNATLSSLRPVKVFGERGSSGGSQLSGRAWHRVTANFWIGTCISRQ